jgi:hypothetical protein|uniref:ORF44 protein n=1 Tax=Plutella xylostella granulovirus TaxID=98383 RepID=A0A142DWC2_9BBAC|nr:PxGV-Corf44 protein [Plutella xylostella granulovirus]AMQ35773.1 PxGV-Korf44 protein [Plutella xylostella granulovirus]AMQ35890.1 PxGV-Morf44 protein [Plutella xylostella granulovirus]AMQ36007.1 PxGV-Torf44 protein [Plutella xylostella granulovirus]QKV49969.1 ORF44 protein [Plutella xylostella granulovirus]
MNTAESVMDFNNGDEQYYVNLDKISNRAEIVELMESVALNNLLKKKMFDIKMKLEMVPIKKSNLKKKLPSLYSNNTYILFTQLFSKLKLTWKASNKMWIRMGVNETTKQPYDPNGHALREILSEIEMFHKQLKFTVNVKDESGNAHEVLDYEKTNGVRKRVVEYSIALLVACYNNEEVTPPPPEDDEHCMVVYKYMDVFSEGMKKFKVFLNNFQHEDEVVVKPKSRISKPKKNTQNKHITSDMVSDLIKSDV